MQRAGRTPTRFPSGTFAAPRRRPSRASRSLARTTGRGMRASVAPAKRKKGAAKAQLKIRVAGETVEVKAAAGKLIVLDGFGDIAKTKEAATRFAKFGWTSVLLIDGAEPSVNFARATRNLKNVDLLPQQGANVYDILRRDTLVLSRTAVEHLEARLK